jgi:hypothetical protein
MDCTGFDSNNILVGATCSVSNVSSLQSPYTTLPTDRNIFIDASAGPVTIVLSVTNCKFIRSDNTTNAVIIQTIHPTTIAGAATYQLYRRGESIEVCLCAGCTDYKITTDTLGKTTTTKGDLLVQNNTHLVRLPVGVNNMVLTADSTTATGVAWKVGGGGGGGTNSAYTITTISIDSLDDVAYATFAYFPWSNAYHGGFTAGAAVFRCVIGTVSPRNLNVRVRDFTNNVTLAEQTNISTSGAQTVSFTSFPPGDADVRVQAQRVGAGGESPVILSMIFEFS